MGPNVCCNPWCIWAIIVMACQTITCLNAINNDTHLTYQGSSPKHPHYMDHPKNIHDKTEDAILLDNPESENLGNSPSSSQSNERLQNIQTREIYPKDSSQAMNLQASRSNNAQRNNMMGRINRTSSGTIYSANSENYNEGSGNGPLQKQGDNQRQPIRFDDTEDSEDDDNDDEDYDDKVGADNGSGSLMNIVKSNRSENLNMAQLGVTSKDTADRQPSSVRENPYLPFRPPSTLAKPTENLDPEGRPYPSPKLPSRDEYMISNSSLNIPDYDQTQRNKLIGQSENDQLGYFLSKNVSSQVQPANHVPSFVANPITEQKFHRTNQSASMSTFGIDPTDKLSSPPANYAKPTRPVSNSSDIDYDYDENTENDEGDDTSNFEDHEPISSSNGPSKTSTTIKPKLPTTIQPARFTEPTYRPVVTTTTSPSTTTLLTTPKTTFAPTLSPIMRVDLPQQIITPLPKPHQIDPKVTTVAPAIMSYASTSGSIGFGEENPEDDEEEEEDEEDEEDEDEDDDEEDGDTIADVVTDSNREVTSAPTQSPRPSTTSFTNPDLINTLNSPPKWTPHSTTTSQLNPYLPSTPNPITITGPAFIPKPIVSTPRPVLYEATEQPQWVSTPSTYDRNHPGSSSIKTTPKTVFSPSSTPIRPIDPKTDDVPPFSKPIDQAPVFQTALPSTTSYPTLVRVSSTTRAPVITSSSTTTLRPATDSYPNLVSKTWPNQNVPKTINILNPFEGKEQRGDDADLTKQIYDKAVEVYDMTSKTVQAAVQSVWPPNFEFSTQSIQPLMARPFLFMLVLGAAIIGLVLIMMLIVYLISYQIMPKDNVSIYSYG